MISDLPSLQPRLGFTSSEPIARKLKAGPLVAVKTTEARPLVLVVVDSRAWHREVDLLLGLLTSTATYVIRLKHFKSSLGRATRLPTYSAKPRAPKPHPSTAIRASSELWPPVPVPALPGCFRRDQGPPCDWAAGHPESPIPLS